VPRYRRLTSHLIRSVAVKRFQFLTAVVLAAALNLMSCSSVQDGPTGPAETPAASALLSSGDGLLGTGIGAGLLACDPLPFASAAQTIGPEGGTIAAGPHTLSVPAGALAVPVLITVEAPVGTVNSVRLLPDGLRFAAGKPARLTLSYANCPIIGRLLPKRIAYTTDLLEIVSYVLSFDNLFQRKITGSLEHFSRYAVAW
jgi:hypothetical protein